MTDPLDQSGAQRPYLLNGGPPIPVEGVRPKRGLALAALIVGAAGFLVGLIPVVGFVLGASGITLGVIALVKKQSKVLALPGMILGLIAIVTSFVVGIALLASIGAAGSSPDSGATERPIPSPSSTPSIEAVPEEAPVVPEPAPDLATFLPVDDRTYALIAKEPDAHIGTNLIAYGVITQLDAATGKCQMLVSTSAAQRELSYEYEENTYVSSGDGDAECPAMDPLVEGDHLKMWVTVLGSLSYDTQIGGNTTVPSFELLQAEILPAQEF